VGIAEIIRTVAELLLSGEGTWLLGLAATSLIAAPLVQRWLAGRKRVYYRVQSDSKIGLDVDLHDADGYADGELITVAKVVDRLTFVVIRIRNTGGDVALSDLGEPMEFTFRERVIWNARISDASVPQHREELINSLEFFSADTPSDRTPPVPLPKVRKELLSRWRELLSTQPAGAQAPVSPEPSAPVWHGIRLRRTLSLAAKEKFKIVVVLSEPPANTGPERTKGVDGPAGHRRIRDERTVRRARWPLVTGGVGVLLIGALVTANLVPVTVDDPLVECVRGDLDVIGSSAFAPIMTTVANRYGAACAGADVRVTATGSIAGVRQLAGVEPARRATVAAMSDGKVSEATPDLVAQPAAVVVYTLVVNDSVGVSGLTVGQVRDIYAGRHHDWAELRPGPPLPIRIVGRGQESGSRRTFEQTVLGATSEGDLTSDSCETTDRVPGAPVIRCERNTETQLIDEVAATPGAIGYVDLPSAGDGLTVLLLDGERPSVSGISAGYPFWTVEYLYTKGVPPAGSLLAAFIDHLRGPAAGALLSGAGYTSCTGKDGQPHLLCS
jgi:ABC-type phosphate transport system substrate-binding protein